MKGDVGLIEAGPPQRPGGAGRDPGPPDRAARPEAATGSGYYVPEVDALRAIAMIAVVAFHCKLLPFGWMGVWLFYVISGFSVTTALFARRQPETSVSAAIGGFYLRRALRIWPVYFAFVGVNVAVLLLLGWTAPLGDLPWLLTFTQNIRMILTDYAPGAAWPAFGHLWTLAVEQQFYLLFPLLLFLSSRTERGCVLLAIIALAPLVRFAVAHWAALQGWDAERIAFAVYAFAPAHFDAFAAGSLIAMFREDIARDRRFLRAAAALSLVVCLLYVGTYGTVGVIAAGGLSIDAMRDIVSGILYGQGRELTVYLLPDCLAATILIGILSGERRCLGLGRSANLQAIGRVSYGGYLFHVPVLMVLNGLVPVFALTHFGPLWLAAHLALFVCALPLTVAVAFLSFTGFEQRFTRLRRGRRGQLVARGGSA
ncbi:MAG TPA: acyltransferase [Rhodopila sp.]|nr:acyltransferase [Rhodopila sp.]